MNVITLLNKRNEIIILIALVIIAFIIRAFLSPPSIYTDSYFYFSQAKENLNGHLYFDFINGKPGVHQPLYPFLIAGLSIFTNNIEQAGILGSAFFGSIVIIPLFYLSKSIYGIRRSWLTSLLVLFDPLLIHWSSSALTESLFIFLFITVVSLSWLAIHKNKSYIYLIIGMIIGLSYLTRVIGITAILIPILAILLTKRFGKEKRINILFSLVFIFIGTIIILPHILYLYSLFGKWTISGFTPYGSIRQNLMKTSFLPTGLKYLTEYGFTGIIAARFLHFIPLYSKILVNVIPIIISLGIIGFFKKRQNSPTAYGETYILISIFIYGIVLALFAHEIFLSDSIRLISPVIPLFFILAANGIVNLSKWITAIFRLDPERVLAKKIFFAIAIVFLISSLYIESGKMKEYSIPVNINIKRLWERKKSVNSHEKIAADMKTHLSPRPRIMSRKPVIPYYLDGIWFMTTDRTYKEEIRSARVQGAEYLLIDGRVDPFLRPKIAFLLDPSLAPPELELVKGYPSQDRKRMGLVIYKIKEDE